jgi:hypothetical protein
VLALHLNIVVVSLLAAQSLSGEDLGFSSGGLQGWQGEGFAVRMAAPGDSTNNYAVTSADGPSGTRKALLHRTFVVPENAGYIRCKAYAERTGNQPTDDPIDIFLLASGKRIVPKQVHTGAGWQSATAILPPKDGNAREYLWSVAGLAGQTLRLVLIDEDDRAGCYLVCGGFEAVSADQQERRDFSEMMVNLAAEHHLVPMVRYDSKHFTALSNAEEMFSEQRLQNCELMFDLFCDHFRRKGFAIRPPPTRLMVAIFDTQSGFEAYLGQRMPSTVTGIYHPQSNRFVMYDFGQNRAYVSAKQSAEQRARRIGSQVDRQRYVGTVQRRAQEVRSDANIATIMHEVAHQLSYNCGILNRQADVPLWLAEGLACYCEATRDGSWQGISEPNPERLQYLVAAVNTNVQFMPVRKLVESARWLSISDRRAVGLLYAQSWALFSSLMDERPGEMRKYLAAIYSRQTPERRAADFEQAFGSNWAEHDRKLDAYVRRLVQQYGHVKR